MRTIKDHKKDIRFRLRNMDTKNLVSEKEFRLRRMCDFTTPQNQFEEDSRWLELIDKELKDREGYC